MATYRQKRQKEIASVPYKFSNLDYTPCLIPLGHTKPTTFNDAVLKVLYTSGAITRGEYMKSLGFEYDFENSSEITDEEFTDDEIGEQFNAGNNVILDESASTQSTQSANISSDTTMDSTGDIETKSESTSDSSSGNDVQQATNSDTTQES